MGLKRSDVAQIMRLPSRCVTSPSCSNWSGHSSTASSTSKKETTVYRGGEIRFWRRCRIALAGSFTRLSTSRPADTGPVQRPQRMNSFARRMTDPTRRQPSSAPSTWRSFPGDITGPAQARPSRIILSGLVRSTEVCPGRPNLSLPSLSMMAGSS